MKRILKIAFVCCINANEISDIASSINKNQAKLDATLQQKKRISSKLDMLGDSINQKLQEVKRIDTQIASISGEIKNNKNQSKNQNEKLNILKDKMLELEKVLQSIGVQLSNTLLRYITYSSVISDAEMEEAYDMQDVVLRDALELIKASSISKMRKLQMEQDTVLKGIDAIGHSISKINSLIQSQEDKQKTLIALKTNQNKLINNIKQEIDSYNKKLKEVEKERQSIDNLLARLNIIRKDKQEETRRKQEQEKTARLHSSKGGKQSLNKNLDDGDGKLGQATRRSHDSAKSDQQIKRNKDDGRNRTTLNVKQFASSYQEARTAKYNGKRTIAPLKSYTLEQAYGPYYDPVYKLKVFNESVVLKSKEKDAMVYNIMDGKVVYAKEMPILKKIVIIEHSNALFSIYSKLDKISPLLKQGHYVKKGAIIGKVSERLHFEITQSDKHIDPMYVISPSK